MASVVVVGGTCTSLALDAVGKADDEGCAVLLEASDDMSLFNQSTEEEDTESEEAHQEATEEAEEATPPEGEREDETREVETCLDIYTLEDFQKMKAVLSRQCFTESDIESFHRLGAIAEERNFTKHGHLHSKYYLHAHRLIQEEDRALFEKLQAVMRKVDQEEWRFLREDVEVNVRVVEYHNYERHGGLFQKDHFDGGSLLTMIVMLSVPGVDFEGGMLQTWESDGDFLSYAMEKGDCVVFPSHKFHNVTSVLSGRRRVIAVELWTGEEGTEDNRPGAFGHLIPDW